MKITSLATYRVAPRWMFLKIETDEGISGWGEPVLEGRARTVETAVHELGETLIGQDPLRINDHWQSMYCGHFYRGGAELDYVVNKDDFRVTDGHMGVLAKPGLGVEIDEARVVHASRNAPDWHNPLWRHADGSVAEW